MNKPITRFKADCLPSRTQTRLCLALGLPIKTNGLPRSPAKLRKLTEHLSEEEVLDLLLRYEGIVGYTTRIVNDLNEIRRATSFSYLKAEQPEQEEEEEE